MTFYIEFSVGLKCSNKFILDNSGVLFHVVTIIIVLLLYNNEISNQICIDFSVENCQRQLQKRVATHYLQSLNVYSVSQPFDMFQRTKTWEKTAVDSHQIYSYNLSSVHRVQTYLYYE